MKEIKLNSYILSDIVLKKMKYQQEESRNKKIEFGFALCKEPDDNVLKIGNDCEGREKCVIRPQMKCKDGENYIGLYHTHPRHTSDPSLADMKNHYVDGFGCIGAGTNNIITCCERKDKFDTDISKRIDNVHYTIQEPMRKSPMGSLMRRSLHRELDEEIENIRRENFKCIFLNL
jgi:hypothetical protein